jgi:hypothetical protein
VEGRVQNVYTDAGFISEKNIQSVPVTFGLLFQSRHHRSAAATLDARCDALARQ